MAINSITGKTDNVTTATTQAKKEKAPSSAPKNGAGALTDKIDITALSKEIQKALAESSPSTPVIDNEKVAAVKQALLQGRYQIDPDSIAEKMLQIDRPFDST